MQKIETPFSGIFIRSRRGKAVPSIRTSGQYKGFHTYCRSLVVVERPDLGTGKIETPFCGIFMRDCRSKIVPSIRKSGQYKDFQSFCRSLVVVERPDVGTGEIETPFVAFLLEVTRARQCHQSEHLATMKTFTLYEIVMYC